MAAYACLLAAGVVLLTLACSAWRRLIGAVLTAAKSLFARGVFSGDLAPAAAAAVAPDATERKDQTDGATAPTARSEATATTTATTMTTKAQTTKTAAAQTPTPTPAQTLTPPFKPTQVPALKPATAEPAAPTEIRGCYRQLAGLCARDYTPRRRLMSRAPLLRQRPSLSPQSLSLLLSDEELARSMPPGYDALGIPLYRSVAGAHLARMALGCGGGSIIGVSMNARASACGGGRRARRSGNGGSDSFSGGGDSRGIAGVGGSDASSEGNDGASVNSGGSDSANESLAAAGVKRLVESHVHDVVEDVAVLDRSLFRNAAADHVDGDGDSGYGSSSSSSSSDLSVAPWAPADIDMADADAITVSCGDGNAVGMLGTDTCLDLDAMLLDPFLAVSPLRPLPSSQSLQQLQEQQVQQQQLQPLPPHVGDITAYHIMTEAEVDVLEPEKPDFDVLAIEHPMAQLSIDDELQDVQQQQQQPYAGVPFGFGVSTDAEAWQGEPPHFMPEQSNDDAMILDDAGVDMDADDAYEPPEPAMPLHQSPPSTMMPRPVMAYAGSPWGGVAGGPGTSGLLQHQEQQQALYQPTHHDPYLQHMPPQQLQHQQQRGQQVTMDVDIDDAASEASYHPPEHISALPPHQQPLPAPHPAQMPDTQSLMGPVMHVAQQQQQQQQQYRQPVDHSSASGYLPIAADADMQWLDVHPPQQQLQYQHPHQQQRLAHHSASVPPPTTNDTDMDEHASFQQLHSSTHASQHHDSVHDPYEPPPAAAADDDDAHSPPPAAPWHADEAGEAYNAVLDHDGHHAENNSHNNTTYNNNNYNGDDDDDELPPSAPWNSGETQGWEIIEGGSHGHGSDGIEEDGHQYGPPPAAPWNTVGAKGAKAAGRDEGYDDGGDSGDDGAPPAAPWNASEVNADADTAAPPPQQQQQQCHGTSGQRSTHEGDADSEASYEPGE